MDHTKKYNINTHLIISAKVGQLDRPAVALDILVVNAIEVYIVEVVGLKRLIIGDEIAEGE